MIFKSAAAKPEIQFPSNVLFSNEVGYVVINEDIPTVVLTKSDLTGVSDGDKVKQLVFGSKDQQAAIHKLTTTNGNISFVDSSKRGHPHTLIIDMSHVEALGNSINTLNNIATDAGHKYQCNVVLKNLSDELLIMLRLTRSDRNFDFLIPQNDEFIQMTASPPSRGK